MSRYSFSNLRDFYLKINKYTCWYFLIDYHICIFVVPCTRLSKFESHSNEEKKRGLSLNEKKMVLALRTKVLSELKTNTSIFSVCIVITNPNPELFYSKGSFSSPIHNSDENGTFTCSCYLHVNAFLQKSHS